jgi:hypothetical protein
MDAISAHSLLSLLRPGSVINSHVLTRVACATDWDFAGYRKLHVHTLPCFLFQSPGCFLPYSKDGRTLRCCLLRGAVAAVPFAALLPACLPREGAGDMFIVHAVAGRRFTDSSSSLGL